MIRANLGLVNENIKRACDRVKRDPESVRILAVTKNFPVGTIEQARLCGLTYFGENRVQEAREKTRSGVFSDARLSLIGHLQTNKASLAARVFDEVQSVDSERVALSLSKYFLQYRTGKLPVFLQINTGLEPKKHGCLPHDVHGLAQTILGLEGLTLVGLMVVAPIAGDPESSRKSFQEIKSIRNVLVGKGIPEENLRELSMGMSSDYEIAVEEGSTVVRLGTSIFGARVYT